MHNCSAHSMEDWVHAATCMGRVDVVEWMCHEQPKLRVSQSILFLMTSQDPIVHQWLLAKQSRGWMKSVMDEAARHGHISVLQRLHEYGFGRCTVNAMNWAARKGYLSLVIWLHENRNEGCTTAAMDWAARKGHLDIVMWLHDNRGEGCTTSAMDWVAKNGDLTMVQWLHANRIEGCTSNAMDLAAKNGDLVMLKWLHRNRCEGCTIAAIDEAARNAHWDVVIWLHVTRKEGCSVLGCKIGGKTRLLRGAHVVSPPVETPFLVLKERFSFELDIREASMEYDEKIALTLGRQGATTDDLEGIPVTSTILDIAATRGFSNIVAHLLRKGIVSCSVIGLYGAIKGGHFDVLVLLYEYDSGLADWPRLQDEWYVLQQFLQPVDEKMLRFFRYHRDMRLRPCDLNWAVHQNDLDSVRLIRELDLVEDTASAVAIAAVSGNMKLLQVLHTGRVPVRYSTLAMDGTSEEGHLSAVRYLHQRDAPCTQAAIDRAAANGHFDVVCYLRVHGKPCSPASLYWAC